MLRNNGPLTCPPEHNPLLIFQVFQTAHVTGNVKSLVNGVFIIFDFLRDHQCMSLIISTLLFGMWAFLSTLTSKRASSPSPLAVRTRESVEKHSFKYVDTAWHTLRRNACCRRSTHKLHTCPIIFTSCITYRSSHIKFQKGYPETLSIFGFCSNIFENI